MSALSLPAASRYLSALIGKHSQELLGPQERRENVLTIAPIGFVVAVLFSLFNTLLAPYQLLGAIEAGCAFLLLLPAMRMVEQPARVRYAENLVMASGVIIFGALIIIGGVGGTGLFWAYTFPFLAFFLKGQRRGWHWNTGFLLLSAFLLLALRGQPFVYPYDPVQIPHYLSSLLFVSLIAACFNLLRSRFHEKLHEAVLENTATAQHYLEQLQFQALHDPATRLPNRTRIQPILEEEIQLCAQRNDQLLVVALRLSRLAEISNIIGSAATDQLMQKIAQTLQRIAGKNGLLGRLSREEFIVLFRLHDKPVDKAMLVQNVAGHQLDFLIDTFPVHIDYTAGMALYPEHGDSSDALLRKAEQAMLQALQHGNTATLYSDDQHQAFVRYHYLFGRLRDAMEYRQLVQHYQPLINLRTRKLVAVEALARWFDPGEGFIAPDEFIPIAESSGLIRPLTRLTVGLAMRSCVSWQRELPGVAVAINLSVRCLFDPELLPGLRSALAETGIAPHLVKLELTETMLLQSAEKALEIMQQIVALGIRLALDDYGTGFSSLTYLKRLPIEELKIDQSFVHQLVEDRGSLAIVSSTIELAHQLGLVVVAEGIENQETMQQLWLLGCDVGQGFYLSKPMPLDDFRAWGQHYRSLRQEDFRDLPPATEPSI